MNRTWGIHKPRALLTRLDTIIGGSVVILCGLAGVGAYYGSVWLVRHEEIEYQLKGALRWVADFAEMLVMVGPFIPICLTVCFGIVLATLFLLLRSAGRKLNATA